MRYLILACLLLSGCNLIHHVAKVSLPTAHGKATVQAPDNASAPTVLKAADKQSEVRIEAGTKAVVPMVVNGVATQATFEFPAILANLQDHSTEATASPERAPDKSVELRKADNSERRPILYVGIALIVGGLALVGIFKHITAGGITATAGVGFILFWHLTGEAWLMNVLIGLAVLGVALAGGYELSEWHKRQALTPSK